MEDTVTKQGKKQNGRRNTGNEEREPDV